MLYMYSAQISAFVHDDHFLALLKTCKITVLPACLASLRQGVSSYASVIMSDGTSQRTT